MRIVAAEAFGVELTLVEPFSIAYSTIEKTVNYFLRLETADGLVGYGCSAFDQEVTNENEKTIAKALNEVAIPILLGRDLFHYKSVIKEIRDAIANEPTALCGVDMALFDLLAKNAKLPLYRLLGKKKERMKTSITIGIMPLKESVEKALSWKKKGYLALKIKGGLSVSQDQEKLIKIREAVGKETEIYFDANQGYTPQEAKEVIDTLVNIGAEFIEQPCKKENYKAFSELRGSLPIMADESVLNSTDALKLISCGGADMYNVKLAKTGGILEAFELDKIASQANSPTMVGCMDEAALGVSAALHFALSSNNVLYADLDGHVEFIDDPSYDAVIIKEGYIYPKEAYGLGFSFK